MKCAFGMLKHRFLAHEEGISRQHENDITKLCTACRTLQRMCVRDGEFEDYVLEKSKMVGDKQTIKGKVGKNRNRERVALLCRKGA